MTNYPSYGSQENPEEPDKKKETFYGFDGRPMSEPGSYGQQQGYNQPQDYGYNEPGSYGAYPGQGYQNYQDPAFGNEGQAGAATPAVGDSNRAELQPESGSLKAIPAIQWAGATLFRNWIVWILGALLYLAAVLGYTFIFSRETSIQFGTTMVETTTMAPGAEILLLLISLAVQPLIYNVAVRQLDRQRITWRDVVEGVNYWPIIGATVLVGLISMAALLVLSIIMGLITTLLMGTAITGQAEGGTLSFISVLALLVLVFLFLVVIMAVTLLFVFSLWLVADRRATVGKSIGESFQAARRNLGKLLLINILGGLATLVMALVTFGLGLIILLPLWQLTVAHLYRQATGGLVPQS